MDFMKELKAKAKQYLTEEQLEIFPTSAEDFTWSILDFHFHMNEFIFLVIKNDIPEDIFPYYRKKMIYYLMDVFKLIDIEKLEYYFGVKHAVMTSPRSDLFVNGKPYWDNRVFVAGSNGTFKRIQQPLSEILKIYYASLEVKEDYFHLKKLLTMGTTEILFDSKKNTLWVHKGNIICLRKDFDIDYYLGISNDINRHDVICVTASVPTQDGNSAEININFCLDCQKFFCSYDEYIYYKEKYDIIIGKFAFTKSGYMDSTKISFAESSPLAMFDYSVSKTANLTAEERQAILSEIIDKNILKKHEVISYLNLFVSMHSKKKSSQNAVIKWKADLEFVRQYHFNEQKQFSIQEISQYSS